jgi:hypothetical protein
VAAFVYVKWKEDGVIWTAEVHKSMSATGMRRRVRVSDRSVRDVKICNS